MEKISVTHTCGDSALKCVDCAEQVCPKCMVQCAVGNRCKKCAGRFTSHVLKVSPLILARLAAAMAVLGFAYGYVEPKFHYMPYGFYGYIVFFFVFSAIGKGMQRVASYKQGAKVFASALVGLIAGLMLGPIRPMLLGALFPDASASAEDADTGEVLLQTCIFVFAVLWPFARKG